MSNNEFKSYYYKAYSFTIKSVFAIPELLPVSSLERADVEIKLAPINQSITNAAHDTYHFQVQGNQFLLDIDQVARYLIENGNLITIEPYEGVTGNEIRLYMLGSAFGALMHQRGLLPVHGSAIIYRNQAILFSGVSGTGKSTLAAGFIKKGVQLLADDVCVITVDENQSPIVHPGYPQMKLWTDSLRKLGLKTGPSITSRSKPKKYSLSFQLEFSSTPIQLAGIYVINKKATEHFQLKELQGPEKLAKLENNIYRNNFLKDMPNHDKPQQLMKTITTNCFIKIVERPSKGFQLDELIQFIEHDLASTV